MARREKTAASRPRVPAAAVAPAARRQRLVRDLMTEKVYSLAPSDTLVDLEDLMDARKIRHVPIVDREGDLLGLVTHRDLSRNVRGRLDELPVGVQRDLLHTRRVREIMTTELETVEPETRLAEAATTLLENKIGCLPVVEGTRLVGILTEADFVRDFLVRG